MDKLNATKTTTMHDFDLGTVLKLMKEAGQVKKVKIIGLPLNRDKKEIRTKIIGILRK